MRTSSLTVSGLALSTTAVAQVVQWGIEKRYDQPRLRRRADDTAQTTIKNERVNGGYFVSVQIGSPPQDLTLQLDTGSSDVWVPYSQASICVHTGFNNPGCTQGSFDPDKSNSFENSREEFLAQYVDQSFAKGNYFQDNFHFGDITVKDLTMGLGTDTNINFGLIGIGYVLDEALGSRTENPYPNLPVALQQEGLINTVAYSLWLNDLDSSTGNLLFGGIDTEKYDGDLTRIPILRDSQINNFTAFAVAVSSVTATSSSGSDNLSSSELPFAAVLDSGTTLSYLPQDVTELIWQEVGAIYDSQNQIAMLPCSFASHGGHFTIGFAGSGGPRISLAMDELVLDLTGGQQPVFPDGPYEGEVACEFGIQNSTSSPYLLGDTFLRSAYVVYDLVNNEIGIAPTKFNSTGSNIVAFKSDGASIPSATAAPDSTLPTSTAPPANTHLSASDGFRKGDGEGDGEGAANVLVVLSWPSAMIIAAVMGFALF